MGTIISLDVGGISIDWSNNGRGNDHGPLFREADRKQVHSDQIDYDYCAAMGVETTAMEMAFECKLQDVVPRLELLGFTLEAVEADYAELVAHQEENLDIEDDAHPLNAMSFDEFCAFVVAHPVQSLEETFIAPITDADRSKMRGRFTAEVTSRLPRNALSAGTAHSERSYFGELIGLFHPYLLLRLLATVRENQGLAVVWQYGPLTNAGWAREEEFQPCARRHQTFLIATEGSSDVHILKHAFELLRPDVADFFRFIDVSGSHPFSGTGSLLRFAEGLAKIDVQNKVVFLFDNDTEGCYAHQRLSQMTLPSNMRTMVLPECEEFRAFPTRGPEGLQQADINRRAAAIECYLDLTASGCPAPRVLWTNFKKDVDAYQGALEEKAEFMHAFLRQTRTTLADGRYNATKLLVVLKAIIEQCSAIAVRTR